MFTKTLLTKNAFMHFKCLSCLSTMPCRTFVNKSAQIKKHSTTLSNLQNSLFRIHIDQRKPASNLWHVRNCATVTDDSKLPSEPPKDSSKDLETYYKLFPRPKNALHNIYDLLAKELGNKELKVAPHFSREAHKKTGLWICNYNVKWPENLNFSCTGKTKQDASHRVALNVLIWLRKNEKITKEGHPVLFGKQEEKIIKKKSLDALILNDSSRKKVRNIIDEYDNFLKSEVNDLDRSSGELQDDLEVTNEPSDVRFRAKPRTLSPGTYLSKEKVVLPISKYKEDIIKLVAENNVVIVKGEPGCGKSTRVPQYVLEAWAREDHSRNCRIAVTQPRRIAAISLAERVSSEREESTGSIVGYQVRLKSQFRPEIGRILYCTTGILLRHLQSDSKLTNFSHIILDEAHERDVNTDLLMNLLKTTIKENPALKLVVMSATIDTDMFQKYFKDAAIIHIPGFTHPVKAHFLDDLRLSLSKTEKMCNSEVPSVVHEDVVKTIQFIHKTKGEGAILCFLPGWEDISKCDKLIPKRGDLTVLCLHSRLQDSDQYKIFSRPPPGVRKIILATNIAETSVTIDDVVYVIDTGIHKEKRFDCEKGVNCIDNHWISKSSMCQRKGRAGRVQPGESFHLYPRQKYEEFAQFSIPEILRTSLTKIVLNCKVYSNNMNALEFMSQLPSPPEDLTTQRAVNELKALELLDEGENLTALGKILADFQLEPKLSKSLVNAVVFKCVTPIVDIVTLFSSEMELFRSGLVDKEGVKRFKSKYSANSDRLALMRIFEHWLGFVEDNDMSGAERFCYASNLVQYKLYTINQLRKIHFDYLRDGLHDTLPLSDDFSDNNELVKAVLLSGVGTILMHRNWDVAKGRLKKSNVLLTNNNHKATITSESVNFKRGFYPSNYLVYINETRSNIRRMTLVRECSLISPLALVLFSNKPLLVSELEDTKSDVRLSLKDTKAEFVCSRELAEDITKCKEALNSVYQYYIYQMTKGGQENARINESWNRILKELNELLTKNSVNN